MKKLNLILPLLCLLLLASCTQTAPTSSEDMLYEVESFYQTNPGKALRFLDNFDFSALSEKEQAHYCLLRTKVYDAHFRHNNEMDSLLIVAENYFVGGDDVHVALCLGGHRLYVGFRGKDKREGGAGVPLLCQLSGVAYYGGVGRYCGKGLVPCGNGFQGKAKNHKDND